MIGLAAPESFAEWREAARRLLAREIEPEEVVWRDDSLFGAAELADLPEAELKPRVPRAFFPLADTLACHRDEVRWPLLYRMLWRLTHEEPRLLDDESDDDVVQATQMEQAVWRDEHKMKVFVRFRLVKEPGALAAAEPGAAEQYVAWHRPDHFVLPRVAPFFVERFHAMRWAILTPDASAHWDGRDLRFGPGAKREDAPQDDELEELWRDYYASIYNPARTNLELMKQHVPVRHWATLPELRDLGALVERAQARVEKMVTETTPEKRSAAAFLPMRALPGSGAQTSLPPVAAQIALPVLSHQPHQPGLTGGTHSLEALGEAARGCQGCELFKTATQTVFGEGPKDARIFLVGEQPGDQEDLAGKAFIGPAGEVLQRALREAGLERGELYVTNAVKHFKWIPRGKKRLHQKPSAREVKACQPWLEAELQTVRPAVIVCLGATAAQAVLGQHVKVSELRGQRVPTSRAPHCVVTYHPSAVLRADDGESIYAALVADLKLAAACLSKPD